MIDYELFLIDDIIFFFVFFSFVCYWQLAAGSSYEIVDHAFSVSWLALISAD